MADSERQRAPVDRLWTPDRERLYNGNSTWIAKRDLKLVDKAVLEPDSLTLVTVGLPRRLTRPYTTPGSARTLISTRSMLAQLNAEVLPGSAETVVAAAARNDTQCEVGIRSYADHTITLQAGTGVGKLARWSRDTLKGLDLEQLVGDGIIKIYGEKGKDWEYHRNREGVPLGLSMPLDPSYRMHLPQIDEDIILNPHISGKKMRRQLDAWLQPVNGSQSPIEISQTLAHLYLPPWIHGLIDTTLEHIPGNRLHINAPFFYGGETGIVGTTKPWPIRTEILRPTDGSPQPDYIVVTLSQTGYDLAS